MATIGITDMSISPESLRAFAEAALQGSFSAAARRLSRSQSTVSEAVASLEIDLGVVLFDRSKRQPVLTEAGRSLLARTREVLEAQDRLVRSAAQMAAGLEPRLTLVVSDTYQSARFEAMLAELDARYPELEFECLIAEGADVLELVQRGRAHIGLLAAQNDYPPDIGFGTALDAAEIGLFTSSRHPLAKMARVTRTDLCRHRELRLNTYLDAPTPTTSGRCWSAPSFLLLMEMAEQGFGWAPLPRWLVARYASRKLTELRTPGWPQRVAVDVVWTTKTRLGTAGSWVIRRLTQE